MVEAVGSGAAAAAAAATTTRVDNVAEDRGKKKTLFLLAVKGRAGIDLIGERPLKERMGWG